MPILTSGLVNRKMARQFLRCLRVAEGDVRAALIEANSLYGLNAARSTEENDSFIEAVVQYEKHYDN